MSTTEKTPDRDPSGERELMPDEQCDRAVLLLLLDEPGSVWSVDEIGRAIESQNDAIDATRHLAQAGLIHRVGDLVFPSLAARRADKLTGAL